MDDTSKLGCYIPKVLPLVYDDTLSYYESICKLINKVNELISASAPNTFNYADPIEWNITTQYTGNTVVVDPKTGTAYISRQAVPSGVYLNNEEYWLKIYNYDEIIDALIEQLGSSEVEDNSSKDYKTGDCIFIKRALYVATRNILNGEAFREGGNIKKITLSNYLTPVYDHANERIILNNMG